jgi:pyruvate formate lyase activating enzyme
MVDRIWTKGIAENGEYIQAMPAKEATPFSQAIDRRVDEGALGTLYEKLPDNQVRCYACAHRCLIKDGLRGICKVRYNRGGTLMVPRGYVGALQCDPIEKKPFFHALPGTDALTFGMLGCDLHCGYCFTGDVRVATNSGMRRLDDLWDKSTPDPFGEAQVRLPPTALTATGDDGRQHSVKSVFRHEYDGELVCVSPRMLAPFNVTPDHEVLATERPGQAAATYVPAGQLTTGHFLAVPRRYEPLQPKTIDVNDLLRPHLGLVRVRRHVAVETARQILQLTAAGTTSKSIGLELGLRADSVRHIRSRVVRRGGIQRSVVDFVPAGLVLEEGSIRFGQERRPGIPARLAMTADLAELLGLYCAEGCVIRAADRPNSHTLTFAFGLHEKPLAERARVLLKQLFGVEAYETVRTTTRAISIGKASLALLFATLCGSGSAKKKIPSAIFEAEPSIADSFLNALVAGDGHRYSNGKISVTTVSEKLARDLAWLVLRLGHLPGIYATNRPAELQILGRTVKLQPRQYTVVWYEHQPRRTAYKTDAEFYYVPIREISRTSYSGYVYNLETDGPHTYLANHAVVHNCQNWVTSQALRDPGALTEPMDVSPPQLVEIAQRQGASVVATSYNEPLITSEWAVEVFKAARPRGFTTAYISNGNATREVLEYIRPYTDLYKIDLKSFRDKNYRSLGGKLENILNGIQMVHEMGFWLEIVTLIIPGFNDSDEELGDIARFLSGISPSIPWHVTAFHKDYKMQDPDNTTPETLLRAARIGEEAGLQYIYAGNLPGRVGPYEDTRCPRCRATLIRRVGYRILDDRLSGRGSCFNCQQQIPGVWRTTINAGRAN